MGYGAGIFSILSGIICLAMLPFSMLPPENFVGISSYVSLISYGAATLGIVSVLSGIGAIRGDNGRGIGAIGLLLGLIGLSIHLFFAFIPANKYMFFG